MVFIFRELSVSSARLEKTFSEVPGLGKTFSALTSSSCFVLKAQGNVNPLGAEPDVHDQDLLNLHVLQRSWSSCFVVTSKGKNIFSVTSAQDLFIRWLPLSSG